MSEKNRKLMFDKLVAAGRLKDIPPALQAEFGDVPTSTSPGPDLDAPLQGQVLNSKKKKGKKKDAAADAIIAEATGNK